ncbi:MAG: hypothetical protein NC548_25605 [Lachnospiraceae bacterium]|nr:hypothetical protein [Lachnospiraceae bacterium]
MDTLETVSALVEADFLADTNFWLDTDGDNVPETPRMPKDDEILSVTWKDLSETAVEGDVSYWYYYNETDGW